MNAHEIGLWLQSRIARALELDAREVDATRPLIELGIDSRSTMVLAQELEALLGRSVDTTLLFEHPTIAELSRSLATSPEPRAAAARVATPCEGAIAVVGMACRFPGAPSVDAFWDLLVRRAMAVGFLPDRTLPPGQWPGSYAGGGDGIPAATIDGVDRFDRRFFRIGEAEALAMDPQSRLLLELSWEALEDACIRPSDLAGSRTGVFMGVTGQEYGAALSRCGIVTPYFAVGNAPCMTANRISYFHDLRGPSLSVDAACASSLVALAVACKSLRSGEVSAALVGAANVLIAPELFTALAQAGMLARDGRCKSFDAAADGYVRGEGAAVVVLKPLQAAIAAGDPIHAVIRGIATNQDGRSNGISAPNAEAHRSVLRDAYLDAGVDPAKVRYVEAHGTGTALGDQIEAESLAAVFGHERGEGPPCLVGAVKANIGHLESASGMAGLLKAILVLRNGWIPGHPSLSTPNPKIPFGANGLELVDEGRPWPDDGGPRWAGVSGFGFGGSNAHCVLEAAPAPSAVTSEPGLAARRPVLLPLSAHSRTSLLAMAQRYEQLLRSGSSAPLADVVRTAAVHRDHGVHRMAVVGETHEALATALAGAGQPGAERVLAIGNKSMCDGAGVAFVFTGQGAQWAGMGRALRGLDVAFDATFDECLTLCERAGDVSLRAAVETGEGLDRTDVCQPVIYAMQLALASLWRSWGVVPGAVVGHSVGELAAAVVAGVLTEEEGARIVAARARLMHRDFGRGLMVAVNLTEARANDELRGYASVLSIAAINAPDWVVVAGDRDAVVDLESRLAEGDVASRRVPVRYGFHSPRMDAAAQELAAVLGPLHPSRSTIPLYSTVSGRVERGDAMGAAYWARAVREPVRLWAALQAVARDGFGLAVQVGPDASLERSLQALARLHPAFVHVTSMRRDQSAARTLMDAAARLYVTGAPLELASLPPWDGKRARLPAYAWDGESFWAPSVEPAARPRAEGEAARAQPAAVEDAREREAPSGAARRGSEPDRPSRARAFEAAWEEAEEGAVVEARAAGRHWRLIGEPGPTAEALLAGLRREGVGDVALHTSVDASAVRGAEVVVDMRAVALARSASSEEIAGACQGLVELANLIERHASRECRLFHLTRGARALPGAAPSAHAVQATVAGAARAIPFDQAGVDCTRIDADPTQEDCWDAVARLLRSDPPEDDYIVRGARRFVPRLRERPLVRTTLGLRGIVEEGRAYLVTGGLGGLGQMLAGDLVAAGARRLILMGRRPPSQRAAQRIATWRAAGVDVVVAACDVGDDASLTRAWREHDIGAALSGIFHVAGLYDEASLTDMTVERMARVMAPKVAGTRNLMRLTEGEALDFIVLYSSVASAVGTLGGVDYAAANAYLDAVATAGGTGTGRLLAVSWGPWAEVGMAAGLERSLVETGIDPIEHADGIAILGDLLRSDARHACVLGFPPGKLLAFNPTGSRSALLSEWAEPLAREHGPIDAEALAECLAAPSAHERRRRFRSLMALEFARPLGFNPSDIDPSGSLQELGMDSLTITQVRVRLQAALGIRISIRQIWESESFQHLSDRLCDEWAAAQLASALSERPADAGEVGHEMEELEL